MGNEQTIESNSYPQTKKLKGLHINTKSIQSLPFSKHATPKSRHRRSTHMILNVTPVCNLSPLTPRSTPIATSRANAAPQNMSARRLLSYRVIKLLLDFWTENIDTLSMEQRLEIGCSIFSLTKAQYPEIFNTRFRTDHLLESHSLKFLDMIGFSVRSVGLHTKNASVLLQQLGKLHDGMNINITCYTTMLKNMHQVFGFHFPRKYTEAVKFALDEVFTYCTQLMTGRDLKILTPLNDIDFMESLQICVASAVGREYLFRYLHQAWCDEMVFFFQLLSRYKAETDDKTRFFIAENLNTFCIKPDSVFSLNVSYELRQKVMEEMNAFAGVVDKDIFMDVEIEIYRLLAQTHWEKFKKDVFEVYLKG